MTECQKNGDWWQNRGNIIIIIIYGFTSVLHAGMCWTGNHIGFSPFRFGKENLAKFVLTIKGPLEKRVKNVCTRFADELKKHGSCCQISIQTFHFARSVSVFPPPSVATSSISRGTAKTPILSLIRRDLSTWKFPERTNDWMLGRAPLFSALLPYKINSLFPSWLCNRLIISIKWNNIAAVPHNASLRHLASNVPQRGRAGSF